MRDSVRADTEMQDAWRLMNPCRDESFSQAMVPQFSGPQPPEWGWDRLPQRQILGKT